MGKKAALFILTLLAAVGGYGQALLYDGVGNLMLKTAYASVGGFGEGLCAVQAGQKWGFIDTKGTLVVPAIYDKVQGFSGGLAAVNVGGRKAGSYDFIGGKWGFIDPTGKVVVELKYTAVQSFMNGLVAAYLGGQHVLKTILDFSYYGLEGGSWGFIDRIGATVIPFQYEYVFQGFSDNIATVNTGDSYFCIDMAGRTLLTTKNAVYFAEGLAPMKDGDKYGYIDRTGAFVIAPAYESARAFKDGLAAVKSNGKWGLIDARGAVVWAPTFAEAPDFVAGLATVKENEKYGYIDRTGRMVIAARFEGANGFGGDMAAVKENGKYGYIDRSGRMAIAAQFDFAGAFSGDTAVVKVGNLYGLINKTGAFVIPLAAATAMYPLSDGIVIVMAVDPLRKVTPGLWAGNMMTFYVSADGTTITAAGSPLESGCSMMPSTQGAGFTTKFYVRSDIPILADGTFSYSGVGGITVEGQFTSPTTASGFSSAYDARNGKSSASWSAAPK